MNIVMLTNTYLPHVGGVARSVEAFSCEYRDRGHRVLIVAPEFPDSPRDEVDVVRIPAIQNFNGSDFSVVLPASALLNETLDKFQPDIVHSHHPFLLGMTAVRIARYQSRPLVFTHHTLYEQYTHYVPGNSPTMKRFAIALATRYANLSDQVFAPSESIRDLLLRRGVTTPTAVVPTGVRPDEFAHGDGPGFRRRLGIPADAFVVGHLGRLAPEKNLEFLTESVAAYLHGERRGCFLVIGDGPFAGRMQDIFKRADLVSRVRFAGIRRGRELVDALHAMDVFAFTSKSETQGMVLTEAMAAGLPVVALNAPGVWEVVRDRGNGRLVSEDSIDAFRDALKSVSGSSTEELRALKRSAVKTADAYSMRRSADKALACYRSLQRKSVAEKDREQRSWEDVLKLMKAEWEILKSVAGAGDEALGNDGGNER